MGQEHKEYTWNLIAKKLTGEASPEELLELEALLRSNPELHYPMQTMADLWKGSGPDDQRMAERAFHRHLDRMLELNIDFIQGGSPVGTVEQNPHSFPENETGSGRSSRINRTRQAMLASAFCLLALGIGIATLIPKSKKTLSNNTIAVPGPGSMINEIFTSNGSRTHLTLPDGTLVWLNAGSRITYEKNYGVTHREVNLTGEAFFDVAHNAGKPFVIHTTRIDIKVLGTRFDVKSYPTDKTTETTLIRGSIEISIMDRPSEKIILKANEKLVVANDDSTLHRAHPGRPAGNGNANESLVTIRKPTYEQGTGAIIETSWIDDKLIFQDEEFKDLAGQMERWYGVAIRFDNPRQEVWRFTGTFQNETVQQALDALQLTANFNYTIQGNQITIYDK